MTDYPDIYVLRHGQTEWNQAGRFQGHLDSPLTDLGVRQAQQQGALLAGLHLDYNETAVYCSPLERASRTARLAGLTATPDARLSEIFFGSLEGQLKSEIKKKLPDVVRSGDLSWHFETPDGERFEAIHARCKSFLLDLSGPAVIVTHGITSIVLRGIWLGLDRSDLAALPVGQGCVYILSDKRQTVLETAVV